MTSGVKQAFPPVLMPKAGVEGKAARNRAPQMDFAETLGIGKVAMQQKSGEAKADLKEAEARPSWQRLAAKIDTAIDRTRDFGRTPEIGRKLDAAPSVPDPEKQPAVEQSADDTEAAAKEMPETAAARHAADAAPAFMSNSQISVVSAKPVEANIPDVHTAPDDNPEIVAVTDAPADDRPAMPRSSAESIVAKERDRSAAPDSSVEGIVVEDRDRSAVPALPMAKPNPATPAAAEPAARPSLVAASADRPSLVAASADREATPGVAKETDTVSEAPGDAAKPVPRVTVLAQQNIPAPMPSTAIVLVESIAASDLLESVKTVLPLDAIHASAAPASARSLKIQLHPAELGMVTATLRFAGEQLSIELQVETHEAHRRLAGDSETIVKSLRDLGYDIDRVTVSQSAVASTTSTARSDGNAGMPSPQGRGPDQFGSGTANGGGGDKNGRSPGEGGNAGGNGRHSPSPRAEPQGSGLYI